jgi:hypothetical protein
MDADRRRLSLSLKRVEEGEVPRPPMGEAAPALDLSEEVFTEPEDEATPEEAPEPEPASADQAAPEQPGPGDSEGEAPSAPSTDE